MNRRSLLASIGAAPLAAIPAVAMARAEMPVLDGTKFAPTAWDWNSGGADVYPSLPQDNGKEYYVTCFARGDVGGKILPGFAYYDRAQYAVIRRCDSVRTVTINRSKSFDITDQEEHDQNYTRMRELADALNSVTPNYNVGREIRATLAR